jgi:hypothetical protein
MVFIAQELREKLAQYIHQELSPFIKWEALNSGQQDRYRQRVDEICKWIQGAGYKIVQLEDKDEDTGD